MQGVRLGTKPQVRADSFSAVRHTTASAAGDLGPSVPRLPPPKRAVLAPGPWRAVGRCVGSTCRSPIALLPSPGLVKAVRSTERRRASELT